jgi:hypothetical protein
MQGIMANEEDEYAIQYVSREEAIATAREQAARDLVVSESVISYVAFVPGMDDFCRCEFRTEASGGWVQSFRLLQATERNSEEQITDSRIREVAGAGRAISAIRLYRAKYGVGLADGKAGVERLLAGGQPPSRQ